MIMILYIEFNYAHPANSSKIQTNKTSSKVLQFTQVIVLKERSSNTLLRLSDLSCINCAWKSIIKNNFNCVKRPFNSIIKQRQWWFKRFDSPV